MSLFANLCTGQKFPAYQLCNLELAQLLLSTSMLAAWAVLKKHLQLALETFSHAFANLAAKLKFLQAFSAWDLCTQRSWDWNYAFPIFTVSDENLQSLDWFLQAFLLKRFAPKDHEIGIIPFQIFTASDQNLESLRLVWSVSRIMYRIRSIQAVRKKTKSSDFHKKFLRGDTNWSYFIPLHGATRNIQWTHPLQ
jgi:hypothetical protein